jgi:hypothetical protein
MKRFTKSQVKEMRTEMEKALNLIAAKYNSTAKVGSISFGLQMTTKITFSQKTKNEHGEYSLTKEAQKLLGMLEGMGLKKDVLNEPFTYLGDKIRILGYNTRAPKYPIQFEQNGQAYKCSVSRMKDMVKTEHPEYFL